MFWICAEVRRYRKVPEEVTICPTRCFRSLNCGMRRLDERSLPRGSLRERLGRGNEENIDIASGLRCGRERWR